MSEEARAGPGLARRGLVSLSTAKLPFKKKKNPGVKDLTIQHSLASQGGSARRARSSRPRRPVQRAQRKCVQMLRRSTSVHNLRYAYHPIRRRLFYVLSIHAPPPPAPESHTTTPLRLPPAPSLLYHVYFMPSVPQPPASPPATLSPLHPHAKFWMRWGGMGGLAEEGVGGRDDREGREGVFLVHVMNGCQS